MNRLVVTIDLDWACEPAIEDTLDTLEKLSISPSVFITHRSARVEASMNSLEVGLHPYFGPNSSHGSSIAEVVNHVTHLPHNFRGFRCHRFATCNESKKALMDAGMLVSSNVCTDLETISPFRDRFGLIEVPIFLEDGGYLWRKYPLEMNNFLLQAIRQPGPKVLLIHPMHFALNTPDFNYMANIKQNISRKEWNELSKNSLDGMRWKGRGIRDLMIEIIESIPLRHTLTNFLGRSLQ